MSSTDNKRIVLEAFAEFARGNHDVLRTVLHEDFVEHSPDNPSGRDAFADFARTMPVARAALDLMRVVADERRSGATSAAACSLRSICASRRAACSAPR